MDTIITSTLLGFLVGMAGTGAGGVAAFLLRRPSRRFMGTILGLSGGLMMAIVCFELLPEAFEMAGLAIGIAGIILGVGLVTLIDMMVPDRDITDKKVRSNGYIRMGMLLGIGIAIHNFPEGLAIGSGLAVNLRLGFRLAFVIGFHNVPEGVAMAMPMIVGGYSRIKIFLATIVAGVPLGLGAFVGALLGEISPVLVSLCLSFAGGTMLYITCGELIPKSQDVYRGRTAAFGVIIGIIAGIVLSAI
ncbi:MAG: ZIP family metal transporter [Bacillota bacterium]|nr:ZIP family metal transporter [Bacillota bacterium]MDD3298340.1 ZIP family metal transporter [Bacillota bacterium]MDD3850557.1 ZIP family metal transporter [Bacillota bacterium]MDD4707338.1 ZIP family metal transporter [Bacillota bacterium]